MFFSLSYSYYTLFLFFVLNSILTYLILFLAFFFSEKKPYVEKVSAYECGFDPDEDTRNTFDIRFYLIAMLFLAFDLEAVFFFPWCISWSLLNEHGYLIMLDFIVELLVGYFYVWQIGALNWH